jgi:DNA ligase 4
LHSVKVFDLLYLNEKCLVDRTIAFRKRNMRQYIKEIQGRIEFTTEFKAKSAKDVRQRMDQVMADRGEGLVMKAPDSAYVLNGRTNDWIKVSPVSRGISIGGNLCLSASRSSQSIWCVMRLSKMSVFNVWAQDNMGETVDVLVVGMCVVLRLGLVPNGPSAGNYGSGKRGGGVSTLICAVLDDEHANDEEPK